MSETDFYPLEVVSLQREPGDGLIVTFKASSADLERFGFKPGQFVILRATIGGEDLQRSYSIASGPAEPLRVGIKRVAGGRFSTYAHEVLRPGDQIDATPPRGRFVLTPSDGTPRHVIALAAGSGITPILGVARQALIHEPNTRFTLVYGNRTRDTILFGEELEGLKDRYLGRFDYLPVFSRNGEVDAPLFEGRLDAEKVRAFDGALTARGVAGADTRQGLIDFRTADRVFLCGPGDMIKSCRDALFALGVARDRVTHEFFASAGVPRQRTQPVAIENTNSAAQAASATGTALTVVLDGIRHRLRQEDGETVLQAALRAGIKAPYACSGGMCSTCRARVASGSARMLLNYSLEPWEIEKGFTLACQAVATSDELVIDWDAM